MKPTLSQLIDYRDRANRLIKLVSDVELLKICKDQIASLNDQIQNYRDNNEHQF